MKECKLPDIRDEVKVGDRVAVQWNGDPQFYVGKVIEEEDGHLGIHNDGGLGFLDDAEHVVDATKFHLVKGLRRICAGVEELLENYEFEVVTDESRELSDGILHKLIPMSLDEWGAEIITAIGKLEG